jgi:hypothetical protein
MMSCPTLFRHIPHILPFSLLSESPNWIHKSFNMISDRNSKFRLASVVWRQSACIVTWQQNLACFVCYSECCQRHAGFFYSIFFSESGAKILVNQLRISLDWFLLYLTLFYSVHFLIHTVIALHICCYTEFSDSYWVHFSIHILIAVFNSLWYGTAEFAPTLLLPPAYQRSYLGYVYHR